MSDLPEQGDEHYLGDGLYVSFDGWHIILRAPKKNGDYWVGLEPSVYQNLLQWLDRYPRLQEHMRAK